MYKWQRLFFALSLCFFLPPLGSAQDLGLEVVASGITEPVFATHSTDPTDTRIFILEKGGRIRVVKNGTLLATPYLDISSIVNTSSEMGLLGLAFDPDFATNGFFYVYYNGTVLNGTGSNVLTVIAAFKQDDTNPDIRDATSGTEILTFTQPQTNHNGGWIGFSPNDDYLYIAVGDGGGQEDDDDGHHPTLGNGQSLETFLGKILRIDVNGENPYSIPGTNPLVGEGEGEGEGETELLEIWAYGLRNPWRCSFDSSTGDFYIGDVGQVTKEEINLQLASSIGGENYGWRRMEGTGCFNPSTNCNLGGLTLPIHEYNRTTGRSVTGGYVYRGSDIPSLEGRYIFGDYFTNRIWSLDPSGAKGDIDVIEHTNDIGWAYSISSFGEDADGEILICAFSWGSPSSVYRLIDLNAGEGEGEGLPDGEGEGEGEGETKEPGQSAMCGPASSNASAHWGDGLLLMGVLTLLITFRQRFAAR